MYPITSNITTILLGCALLSGACDLEPAPGAERDAASVTHAADLTVNDLQMNPITAAVDVRIGQLADGSLGVLDDADGRPIAPGVWEVEADDGLVQQVIVGAAGHRWLLAEMLAELDSLSTEPDADAGRVEALREQIAAAKQAIAAHSQDTLTQPGGVQALSCNVGLYAGPSGPVTGIPGAAAFAQSSCSGGCATITVRSQACCSGTCTPLNIATNTVCSPLWTSGVIRQGSGPGWAQVYVAPVSVTNQGFLCS